MFVNQSRATKRNTCLHVLLALGVPSLQYDLRYTQKLTDPEQVFLFQNAEDFQIVFDNINNVKISFLEVDDEDVHLVVGRMHRQDVRSVWTQSTSDYLDLKFQNNSFVVKCLNLSHYLDLRFQNNFFAFKSLNLINYLDIEFQKKTFCFQQFEPQRFETSLKQSALGFHSRREKPDKSGQKKRKKDRSFLLAKMLTSSTNVVSRLAVTPSMQPIRTLV